MASRHPLWLSSHASQGATQSLLPWCIKVSRRVFPFLSSAPRRKGILSKVLEVQSHKMAEARDFFTHLLLFSDMSSWCCIPLCHQGIGKGHLGAQEDGGAVSCSTNMEV